MTEQIIHWLILCDVKLVVFGGSGTISRRSPHVYDLGSCKPSPQSDVAVEETTTQHFTTENSVPPPPDRLRAGVSHRETSVAWSHPCSPVLVLKEGILRDAVVFHRRSQQFLRKIAMLDRHHRSRGSAQDEAEVTATAGRLANDLHRLSHDRPSIMHCSPEDLHQLLQIKLARDVSRVICVFRACFWSKFCYLYRAAWWHHSIQGDEKLAADETWRALRGQCRPTL
ncbi:hypothetical protein BDV23DRAFT_19798 [Aspergillus alliaceus]|uniref:Uncharacterized protein n=1 Tax=Petromyces alliaceus TaxID=209559 RepID=A0A5N7BU97_PETAA|nr:hypothetical protein BDV23DRAFT_19798 [Aspergillus alliaceus]